jgi:DNA-binding MarR family transcriptional regulator
VDTAQKAQADVAQVQSAIEPIVAKETELESSSKHLESVASATGNDLSPDQKKVLDVLAEGKWTLRSQTGISRDSAMERSQVADVLQQLEARGWVAHRTGDNGTRWFITDNGRAQRQNLSR